ncbi:XK-related protein 4 [Chionoecetes opilio]|uniref:XK-related protein n=1 Tax=Chionoecetes opilio TaxID=41210 RepID=A0A8J4YHM5_CHIOP|nr:XK-related protein 4 [Chionoecetes opilio]
MYAGEVKSERFEPVIKMIVLFFSVTFYIADLCLDLWVCAVHFQSERSRSAWFIFFCILLPNLYAGYKSLQWYLRAHEHYPIRRPAVWIVRVLFFPISPILRRARRHWRNKNFTLEQRNFENYLVEIAEVALLRLVIIFLEDAPIVVLNLAQLLQMPPSTFTLPVPTEANASYVQPTASVNVTGIAVYPPTTPLPPYDPITVLAVRLGSVVAKLTCTMTLGVVHYVSCNKLAWHLANTSQRAQQREGRGATRSPLDTLAAPSETKGVLSWTAEATIYCWQLLAIGSRVVAYALLWVIHFDWLWLPISLRWLMHALWIYFDVAEMSLVNSVAFGGIYLFSFVTTSPGRQILRIALYYTITLSEHLIIALLWHSAAPDNPYHDLGIGILFGGALGGLLFLSLYYGCCHPDKANTWFWHQWRQRKAGRGKITIFVDIFSLADQLLFLHLENQSADGQHLA